MNNIKDEKQTIIRDYLPASLQPSSEPVQVFAPSNIALCKYWGKRNQSLNLPITDSLSISMGHLGTTTTIESSSDSNDHVYFDGQQLDLKTSLFANKIIDFVGLFRQSNGLPLTIQTTNNIPTAAGVASSASGFAALMLALNVYFNLRLEQSQLSCFARMGSGSASRSVFKGFVKWNKGVREDGMDSHGEQLSKHWPNLRIGLLIIDGEKKSVGSREGMARTIETSALYKSWPEQASQDLLRLEQAIATDDFNLLGEVAEHNAMSMHATMISSWPPLVYWLPESVESMHRIWDLRADGVNVFFTMDAGPNLKLIFETESEHIIKEGFPNLIIATPFD